MSPAELAQSQASARISALSIPSSSGYRCASCRSWKSLPIDVQRSRLAIGIDALVTSVVTAGVEPDSYAHMLAGALYAKFLVSMNGPCADYRCSWRRHHPPAVNPHLGGRWLVRGSQ